MVVTTETRETDMMHIQMKPDTIARRAAKRVIDTATRRAASADRLRALAERDGPDSIWVELLAEQKS